MSTLRSDCHRLRGDSCSNPPPDACTAGGGPSTSSPRYPWPRAVTWPRLTVSTTATSVGFC